MSERTIQRAPACPLDDQVPVFAWMTGQDFNIGDSLLRRPYLASLADLGPVDVWVRTASESFLTGLGTENAARISRSFPRWYGRLLLSVVRRRTVIALNAGEMQISRSRALLVLLLWFAARLARLRGGASVWLGASVRPTADPLLRAVYRLAARDVTVVQWREAGSLRTAGQRPVGPDWAFATGTPTQEWDVTGRDVAAFVMRSDRETPTTVWREWARSLVVTLGLKPVFVVQVEIDDGLARELAAELGGRVLPWEPNVPHNVQEARVRELFRHSRIAVGDRLHGLIVAATEGAVPIGWVDTSNQKVASHFGAAGMAYVGEFEGINFPHPPPMLTPERLSELVAALPAAVEECRRVLAEITASLRGDSKVGDCLIHDADGHDAKYDQRR